MLKDKAPTTGTELLQRVFPILNVEGTSEETHPELKRKDRYHNVFLYTNDKKVKHPLLTPLKEALIRHNILHFEQSRMEYLRGDDQIKTITDYYFFINEAQLSAHIDEIWQEMKTLGTPNTVIDMFAARKNPPKHIVGSITEDKRSSGGSTVVRLDGWRRST